MLNFALCDDNYSAIDKLSKMLNSILISNNLKGQITFTSSSPDKLLNFVKHNPVHVLLLDIDLKSTKSGIELAEQIRAIDKSVYIIFITGHFEFSLIAYKCKTFEETILRLYSDVFGDTSRYIRLDNNKTVIKEDSIRFIKKDGMKVIFHTDTRDYETYSSFNKISDMLPYNFVRCHKSYIVNVGKISDIDIPKNTIHFSNNDSCYIGPKYKEILMEVLENEYDTDDMVSFDIAK